MAFVPPFENAIALGQWGEVHGTEHGFEEPDDLGSSPGMKCTNCVILDKLHSLLALAGVAQWDGVSS